MIQFSGNYEIKLAPKRGRIRPGDHLEAASSVMDKLTQRTTSPVVMNYYMDPETKKPRLSLLTNDKEGNHANQYIKYLYKISPPAEPNRKVDKRSDKLDQRDSQLDVMDAHYYLMSMFLQNAKPIIVNYERTRKNHFRLNHIDFKG